MNGDHSSHDTTNNEEQLKKERIKKEALEKVKRLNENKALDKVVNAVNSHLLHTRMDNTYLVFEYLDHDLAGLLDSKYEFTPSEVKCIMKQLFEVLKYLEDEHILHRDIKCGNILINNGHHVKLADFGLARSTIVNGRGGVDMTNNVVTMWYKAPELILGSVRYGHSVDVWSTACVMAELELGKPLMPGRTEVEQMDLICQVIGTPTEFSWAEATELPKYRES